MKRIIVLLVAGFLMASAGLSYALCCKGATDKAATCGKAAKGCYLEKSVAKLNLNAETKAKVDPILASCKKDGCSKETCDKAMKELEGVLTAEQFTQLKEHCKKACAGMEKKSSKGKKTEKSQSPTEEKTGK